MKYLKTYESFRILNEEIFGLFGSNNGQKRYKKLEDKDLISFIQDNSKELEGKFSVPWKTNLIQNISNKDEIIKILNDIKNESSLDGFISDLELSKNIKLKSVEKDPSQEKKDEPQPSKEKENTNLQDTELRTFLEKWKVEWENIIGEGINEKYINGLYNFLKWEPEFQNGLLKGESMGPDETDRSINFLKLIQKYNPQSLKEKLDIINKKREELFKEIKKYLPNFNIDDPKTHEKFFKASNDKPYIRLEDFLENLNLFTKNEYSSPINKKLEFISEKLEKFSFDTDVKKLGIDILRDKKLIVDRNGFVTYHGSDRDNYGDDKFASTINFKKRKGLGLFTSDLKTAIQYAIAQTKGGMAGSKAEEGDKVTIYRIVLNSKPFLLGNENEVSFSEMKVLLDFGFGGLDGIGQTDNEREIIIVTPDAIEGAELISQGDDEFGKILKMAEQKGGGHRVSGKKMD
jgi:hypothetical protein